MQTLKYITSIILLLLLISCEDVVDVNLTTAAPKLVIDASINWQKGTDGRIQKVLLSTTTDFYSTVIPKVSGATVKITNSDNIIFNFVETANTGEYVCINFVPIIGETYFLTVTYKNEVYTATEIMQSVTKIDNITQVNNAGFSGKDYEIQVFFSDPPSINYYMAKFFPDFLKAPVFQARGDEFTNGNEKSWSYSSSDLKPGNTVAITHYGISKNYYNFMNKLISISGSSGGGSPFQTPPATLRGNFINQTNLENYALGYFSLGEIDIQNYKIE